MLNSNHPNSIQDTHLNGRHHTAKLKHYSELASPGIENQWGSQITDIPWNNIHLQFAHISERRQSLKRESVKNGGLI